MRVFALSGGYTREEAAARLKAGGVVAFAFAFAFALRSVVYQVFYTIHDTPVCIRARFDGGGGFN